MKVTIVVALLVLFPVPLLAQNAGETLLQSCKAAERHYDHQKLSPEDAVNAGMCMGFVAGVITTDKSYWRFTPKIPHICVPDNGNTEQAVRVVLKWMNDHPDKLNLPTITIVGSALSAAFPCK